ncbi:MAG TPA: MerR family transcriptional regulator [Thermomicrobiaceae bacterium]|nr:MerR family transcriptional regulator [Thermomicrobiaceae bacterium]
MDESGELTIEELAERVDVPVRTVRYYIAEGLLPGPGTRGKTASYGEEHLLRLRLARRLAERRVPLAEIRERIRWLSLEELRELLREEDRRADELRSAEQTQSPRAYVSALLEQARAGRPPVQPEIQPLATLISPPPPAHSAAAPSAPPAPAASEPGVTWERRELAPGVELHVRSDASVRQRGLIERLLRAAGILSDRHGGEPPAGERGHR